MSAISDEPTAWLASIHERMFAAMHTQEADNFDSYRYPEEQRKLFFYPLHAHYLTLLARSAAKFFDARALLQDNESRDLFDNLILYRLLGHSHVRLPHQEKLRRRDVPAQWKIDETGDTGAFGNLKIFAVPYKGTDVWIKGMASNVAATFLSGQYYFDRDGIKVAPSPGDHIVDGGGCFGDTALAFATDVGRNGHIYTFDPILKHCEIMREAFQMNSQLADRISLFDVGISDVNSERSAMTQSSSAIDPGARLQQGLPTRTLDAMVDSGDISRIDMIKLDVEGSELAALNGARRAIERWHPKLAISLYHRPEDFFSIPLWLSSLNCGYRLYLDHYTIHQEETVLYGIAGP
jgi:FkbM family methyltransferase